MQHRNQLGLWVAMVAIAAACTAAAAAPHPTTGQEAAVLSKAADLASKAANLANKEKGVLMVKLIGFPKTPVQQPGCSQNSQGKGFVFNNILSHLGKFKGNGQPCAASPSPLPPGELAVSVHQANVHPCVAAAPAIMHIPSLHRPAATRILAHAVGVPAAVDSSVAFYAHVLFSFAHVDGHMLLFFSCSVGDRKSVV